MHVLVITLRSRCLSHKLSPSGSRFVQLTINIMFLYCLAVHSTPIDVINLSINKNNKASLLLSVE